MRRGGGTCERRSARAARGPTCATLVLRARARALTHAAAPPAAPPPAVALVVTLLPGCTELTRALGGGGDAAAYDDAAACVAYPEFTFRFSARWAFERFRRVMADVERTFGVRQLQESLERDIGIPVRAGECARRAPAAAARVPWPYPVAPARPLHVTALAAPYLPLAG